jgi:hypothetical protein
MGSGFRTFTAGEVLTASNVQNYLMDQSVMVFGGSAARSSAIGTANFEEGMVSYLTDTDKVESYNGTNWVQVGSSNQGLTLINTTSFSGVSTISLPQDSFTTTYDNYKIIFAFTQTVSGGVAIRMRLAGTDNTAYSYQIQHIDVQSTSVAGSRVTTTSSSMGQGGTSGPQMIHLDIYGPKLAQNTLYRGVNVPTDAADIMFRDVAGRHTVATAYDSMTFISAGNFTGSATLYGYNK